MLVLLGYCLIWLMIANWSLIDSSLKHFLPHHLSYFAPHLPLKSMLLPPEFLWSLVSCSSVADLLSLGFHSLLLFCFCLISLWFLLKANLVQKLLYFFLMLSLLVYFHRAVEKNLHMSYFDCSCWEHLWFLLLMLFRGSFWILWQFLVLLFLGWSCCTHLFVLLLSLLLMFCCTRWNNQQLLVLLLSGCNCWDNLQVVSFCFSCFGTRSGLTWTNKPFVSNYPTCILKSLKEQAKS